MLFLVLIKFPVDLQADERFWTGGSSDQSMVPTSFATADQHHYNNRCVKPSPMGKLEDQYGGSCDNGPVNRMMSSNMRLMRKMMNSERTVTDKLIGDAQTCPNDMRSRSWDHDKSNNSTNNVIRVCSDCNTTKTPLWRSGPRGPKVKLSLSILLHL